MNTVYKVVRKVGNRHYSLMMRLPQWKHQYIMGIINRPKFGISKFFAFRELSDAKEMRSQFLILELPCEILICETPDTIPCERVPYLNPTQEIALAFWNGCRVLNTLELHNSTVLCSWLKPIRVYQPQSPMKKKLVFKTQEPPQDTGNLTLDMI